MHDLGSLHTKSSICLPLTSNHRQMRRLIFGRLWQTWHFSLHGKVNFKNCAFWGNNPPQFVYEKPLHDEHCTDWSALSSHGVIGSFRFEDGGQTQTVMNAGYLKVLKQFHATLRRRGHCLGAWFQQDGATPHTVRVTLRWLEEKFEGRVISRKTQHAWSQHSPDLNTLDFFCLGLSKEPCVS